MHPVLLDKCCGVFSGVLRCGVSNQLLNQSDIATAAELAADFKTTKPSVLSWFHRGLIPAVVADGRIIRFSRAAVAQALADRANKKVRA